MSARGFFHELVPLLEKNRPYGSLDMTTEELAKHFKVSLQMVRRYLHSLKTHQVLRKNKEGVLFCPVLIREFFKKQ